MFYLFFADVTIIAEWNATTGDDDNQATGMDLF